MRITSLDRVLDFSKRHSDVTDRLAAWVRIVTEANWRSLIDVRRTYPKADGVSVESGRIVTVFNIGGNRYRLLTAVNYQLGIVNVLDLLTHAEYDKEKWKKTL